MGIEILQCDNNWKKGQFNYFTTFQHLMCISTYLLCNMSKSTPEKSDELSVIFLSFFTVFYISSSWCSFHCLSVFPATAVPHLTVVVVVVSTILRWKLLNNYFCREATDVKTFRNWEIHVTAFKLKTGKKNPQTALRRSGERDKRRQEIEQNLSLQIALVHMHTIC